MDSSNTEKVEFPEIDGFIIWLLERAKFEVSEDQMVLLADRFLSGIPILMKSDKNVVLVVNGGKYDWSVLEAAKNNEEKS